MVASSLVCSARGWLLAASLAGASWLVGSCSGAHEPVQRGPETTRLRPEIKPTANVPALLGKSIEELRRRLGAAQPLPLIFTDLTLYDNLAPQPTDSVLVFRTGGLLLAASYNTRSRRVNDLLLLGRHEDSLMHRATLRADAPGYLILPLFYPKRPGALLGLRVIPAERQ
ncbi:MAG: hypothetical protein ACRYFK_20040 [Janthinobacterium lividum]